MDSKMKVGAAYVRVSTDDQLDYSPESQINSIREYAQNHNIVIPDEYIYRDDGISGRKVSMRAGFQQMIHDAKQKPSPYSVILVWKFSRFARNREDSIVYKSMLRKQCGIDVVSVAEPLSDDKTSILIEALLEAMDEYYSINLGEEVKRGMSEKATRGEPLSIPAYGYEIINKEYIINESEAKIVRYIFDCFLSGDSIRQITHKCNELGVRSHRGNVFESRIVEYILQNPVYTGKIRWNPTGKTGRDFSNPNIQTYDGKHEPIVDESAWNEVQKIFKKNKSVHVRCEKPFSSENILQSLVRCSACNGTLVKCGKYLQCQRYTKSKCRVSHCLGYDKAVDVVTRHLENTFDLKLRPQNLKPIVSDFENDIIYNRIKAEERRLMRVKEAYLAGADSIEEYKSSKNAILKNIEDLKNKAEKNNKIHHASSIRSETPRSIKGIMTSNNIDSKTKNAILKSFINKIVYIKEKNELEFYYFI